LHRVVAGVQPYTPGDHVPVGGGCPELVLLSTGAVLVLPRLTVVGAGSPYLAKMEASNEEAPPLVAAVQAYT
jgi:hypothetical protein